MMATRKYSFSGTHQEIGEQIGELYRSWGKRELIVPAHTIVYFPQQKALYEQFFPEYIDFLKGVAKGLGSDVDRTLLSYLAGYLELPGTHSCSCIALQSNEGIFIGRNYDWMEASENYSAIIRLSYTDGSGHDITGISDMGTWEFGMKTDISKFEMVFDDAWNDKGLYVCINGAPGENRSIGISTPHIVQLIAEKASSTAEAISLIEKIPTPDPKLFTLADRSGHFAVVEKRVGLPIHVRESQKYIITTNHFLHPDNELDNIDIFTHIPFHSTFARYYYLNLALQGNYQNMTGKEIMELLLHPPALQNWRGVRNGDTITLWIYHLNLKDNAGEIIFAPLKQKSALLLKN